MYKGRVPPRAGLGDLDLDVFVVERALAQSLAHDLARRVVGGSTLRRAEVRTRRRHERVEHAVLGRILGKAALGADLTLAFLLDRHLDQVTNDGVDVLADLAHPGELGRLDLDDRRVGQAC